MEFTTLNIEASAKSENCVCWISVIDYYNYEITSKRGWLVQPPKNKYDKNYKSFTTLSPIDTRNKSDIYDIWEEVETSLYNKMVISYNANYNFSRLVSSFNYFRGKELSQNPNIEVKNNSLKCEFICLSLLLRRLFTNLNSTSLSELCQKVIGSERNDLGVNDDLKIGFLFKEVLKYINIDDFIQLKHLAGITFGQVHKYVVFKNFSPKTPLKYTQEELIKHAEYEERVSSLLSIINSLENAKKPKITIEFPKEYYPCLPITDIQDFRKYDFNDLIMQKKKFKRAINEEED